MCSLSLSLKLIQWGCVKGTWDMLEQEQMRACLTGKEWFLVASVGQVTVLSQSVLKRGWGTRGHFRIGSKQPLAWDSWTELNNITHHMLALAEAGADTPTWLS